MPTTARGETAHASEWRDVMYCSNRGYGAVHPDDRQRETDPGTPFGSVCDTASASSTERNLREGSGLLALDLSPVWRSRNEVVNILPSRVKKTESPFHAAVTTCESAR